ncbi:MAG: transcription elongation factor GreA [Lachnospiraceae bacterium]|nr:transcription elongation factor GreA [Lachnospiraceae bacterium]MDY6352951.1 transcription elongation factor GreA [Lachnospiraceae bacterium]
MGERLTRTDVEKIQEELRQRKEEMRPKLIDEVKETRAMGDLSENFEYHAAKSAKNRNESRIRYLERMLANATIVSEESKAGVVGMNNTVTIYEPEDDETETVKITTSIRSDALNGRVSIESPLGKALVGRKEGDEVTVRVDDSYSYKVIIKKIDQTTDSSDDQISSY